MFDNIVIATRSMCGIYDDSSGRPLFRNPSLGLKLGHNLAKCAALKKGVALRAADWVSVEEANNFLSLHNSEWTSRISSVSLITRVMADDSNEEKLE